MNRLFLTLLLLVLSSLTKADILQCVEELPVTIDDIDEILEGRSEKEKSLIQDISGYKNKLMSQECWDRYQYRGSHSDYNYAVVFPLAKKMNGALCESKFIPMGFGNGSWNEIKINSNEHYSIALEPDNGCRSLKSEDFVFSSSEIEYPTDLTLLKSKRSIIDQYYKSEPHPGDLLKLLGIEVENKSTPETYYTLIFSSPACFTYHLNVKFDEDGNLVYVSSSTFVC